MHLSHVFEDLEAWYLNIRLPRARGHDVQPRARAWRKGRRPFRRRRRTSSAAQVEQEFTARRRIGHSAAIQSTSRLLEDIRDPTGPSTPRARRSPSRPTSTRSTIRSSGARSPERDGMARSRGRLHFVVFNPTSDDFHRNRLAMDGVLPDGASVQFPPRARGRASTRSCARPTGRTSSCHRGGIARSR